MKVRCIGDRLTEEQRRTVGFRAWEDPHFQISPGTIYTVLGLTAKPDYMAGAVVQVHDDGDRCAFVPICLFEIVDGRPSQYWRARLLNEHGLALWPEEFYSDEHFHENLSEGERAAVETYSKVLNALELEGDQPA
jgi:hypothetical protein